MRFKAFMEDSTLPNKPTSKSITFVNAVKWAKTMAPNVMRKVLAGKFHMYRGVDGTKGEYQLGNTANFKRVSKNTANYYTKLIATSKAWEKYPSRESAYVCATSGRIAQGYGKVFFVIPADTAKVGVVDSHDLWKGFPAIERILEIPGLNSLNDVLVEMMKVLEGKVLPDNDIEALRSAMRGWTMKRLYDMVESNKKIPYFVRDAAESGVQFMARKGMSNFEELIDYCLDPEVNNFHTMEAKDATLSDKPGKEVWFEGSCIFIAYAALEEFLEEYKK